MKINLVLILILVLGGVLRLINLSVNPPSLSWDEVSHGYNAYSLLMTGRDEWGESWPIANFRAYGDYPTTLYMYFAMPVIYMLGLDEFSVRLPSVIFGLIQILAAYLLTGTIFKNKSLGLICALLFAVSPWTILTSRQVLQATPAVALMMLGIWSFLRGGYGAILGVIFLGLSAYAYHNTRIFSPVIFVTFLLFYYRFWLLHKKIFLIVAMIGVMFFGPLVWVLSSAEGSARAVWVGILDQGAINRINESRSKSDLPNPFPKLINNKFTYFSQVAATNYIGYFSPQFLAIRGGTQYQFSVPNFGVILPVELPFFYLGLFLGLWHFLQSMEFKRRKFVKWNSRLSLIMIVLLMSPVPAAITRDPYQVVRGLTLMPFIHILSCFGLLVFWKYIRSRKKLAATFIIVSTLLLLVPSVNYLYNLYFIYPRDYSFAWQYGYKQAINYAVARQDKYSKVIFTKKYGEPHEFVLFFTKYNPVLYRDDPWLVRYNRSNWFWTDTFANYEFINDWEIKERLVLRRGVLLVTSPGNYPKNAKLLNTVDYLDGKPAFDIVEL